MIHAIRDYNGSKEVWAAFVPPQLLAGFFTSDLQPRLLRNLNERSDSIHGGGWPKVVAVITCKLWKWHCLELFEGQRISLERRVETIQHNITEAQRAFATGLLHLGSWWLENNGPT